MPNQQATVPINARRQADRYIAHVVGGPVDQDTLRLLWSSSQGDRVLIRSLVLIGLDMGELAFHGGMWRWGAAPDSPAVRLASLIKSRGAALDTLQMETLRRMVRPLCEPHAVITQLLAAATHQVRLTPRESEVLDLLCTGLSAAVISRRLGLSPRTVTKHQERLYRKLGTSDRLNTVLRAKALGIA